MTARDIGNLVRGMIEAAKGRRQKPSERNLQIHQQVRVEGDDPWEVAALHEISRRRVSAICQQVDRWYGEEEPWRLGNLAGAAQRQAERLVAKRRLEHVYSWALRGLKTSGQSITEGHTTMTEGSPTVRKQVQKDQPFNVQWLKVAKGVAEKLIALSQEDEAGAVAPPARVARGEAVLRAAACLRRAIRQEAQQAGPEGIGQLIEQVVRACVGEEPERELLEASPRSPALESSSPEVPVASAVEVPRKNCSNYSRDRAGNSPEPIEVAASASGANGAAGDTCDASRARKSPSKRSAGSVEKNVRGIGQGR